MTTGHLRGLKAALPLGAAALWTVLSPLARAQNPKPKTPASPAASVAAPAAGAPTAATAPPGRTITLSFARPGAYDYWTVGKSGPGAILTAAAGAKEFPVTVPTDATSLDVLDNSSGLVASLDASKLTGSTVTITPNDFTRLRTVKLNVTANGGKPVEKAQVTLTDANGKTDAKVLTADDAGAAQFNDVPLGKATIAANFAGTGAKTSTDVTLAPGKGGGPAMVTVALTGDVPTLAVASPSAAPAAAPAVNVSVAAPAESNTTNSWMPGFIGVILLGIAGYYGFRAAKARGMTVESALKQIGVETPANSPVGAAAAVKPAPAPLPPLPSLSDMPSAGPAPRAAAAFGGGGTATAVGPPRITGIAGPVSGESFDLDAGTPLTIGRDVANTLSLAQDTAVSRRHARFERGAGGWQVADDGSSNGTFVNGARVGATPQSLRAGDEIQIGGSRFRFEGG